ncbi:MAG: diacylglycerol kinase family protein [Firmicutes bacterium]|nr:diacylglycerol kinase family protein [Bacillota bacterium]
MKIIFVINPKAGKGKGIDKLTEKIRSASDKTGIKADIYMTKAAGDAEAFADLMGKETEASGEEVRLIACGGDGTLNEVLNGAIKYENLTVGVVPIGTGNDFCRNFPDDGDFLDMEAQLTGKVIKSDAIRYSGLMAGKEQTRYCANMFNIGFDCNVVDLTAKLKTYPLIAGSFAYLLGVAITFIKKKGAKLRVELDGEVIEDGSLLLTAIANGGFCGGGVHSSPYASVTDGIMDVNVIYNVSRWQFLKKFPYYAKGTHMELPGISDIIYAGTCRKARITPLDGTMRLCTDGEIVDAGTIDFEIVPEAFNLLVPAVI